MCELAARDGHPLNGVPMDPPAGSRMCPAIRYWLQSDFRLTPASA